MTQLQLLATQVNSNIISVAENNLDNTLISSLKRALSIAEMMNGQPVQATVLLNPIVVRKVLLNLKEATRRQEFKVSTLRHTASAIIAFAAQFNQEIMDESGKPLLDDANFEAIKDTIEACKLPSPSRSAKAGEVLTPEEVWEMIACAYDGIREHKNRLTDLRNASAIGLQFFTGLRPQSVVTVKREELNDKSSPMEFKGTWMPKTMKTSAAFILPSNFQAMREYLDARDSFVSGLSKAEKETYADIICNLFLPCDTSGRRFDLERGFSVGAYQQLYRRIAEAEGFPTASYTARRTLATTLYKKSNDIMVVQEALGHQNIQTTSGYIKNEKGKLDSDSLY